MGGVNSAFDAADFRAAIQFAFTMAAPPDPARALSFHFDPATTWSGRVDGDGQPFDPTATATTITKDPVTVACGVEIEKTPEQSTAFGVVLPTKVKVTLLDVDYAQVADADYVMLDGEKYVKDTTNAPTGLFDVGIFSITYTAQNDA